MRTRIYENYRDNNDLREKYYQFTQAVFPGIDFKTWYEKGHWIDNYQPHSIIDENRIVSNVSVSSMDLIINGQKRKGIQIGAVGTIAEFRNRGLSRYLMDYVIDKYDSITDIMFLFANETVLDFYPKFGFKPQNEVIFRSKNIPKSEYAARKLDLRIKSDMDIISNYLKERKTLTRIFGAVGYDFITQWHLINVFSDNLIYLEDEDVIVICSEKDRQLHLWDVIYSKPIQLDFIIPKIMQNNGLQSLLYYFPPDELSFDYDELIPDDDSHLFVRGDFGVGRSRFKFPVTAQT